MIELDDIVANLHDILDHDLTARLRKSLGTFGDTNVLLIVFPAGDSDKRKQSLVP